MYKVVDLDLILSSVWAVRVIGWGNFFDRSEVMCQG